MADQHRGQGERKGLGVARCEGVGEDPGTLVDKWYGHGVIRSRVNAGDLKAFEKRIADVDTVDGDWLGVGIAGRHDQFDRLIDFGR